MQQTATFKKTLRILELLVLFFGIPLLIYMDRDFIHPSIIILPVLWTAAGAYLATRASPVGTPDVSQQEQMLQNYYRFPLSTLPYLAAPVWFLMLGAVASVVGLITRNILVGISLLWALLLLLAGNFYLLDIPALKFTNLGAVLIMLYIPLSVIIGAALEEGLRGLPKTWLHVPDELYHKLRGPAKNMTILATSFSDKKKGGTGRHEPALFTIRYGKGRIFHTILGHDAPQARCAGFVFTLQRGTEWAATGKVSGSE